MEDQGTPPPETHARKNCTKQATKGEAAMQKMRNWKVMLANEGNVANKGGAHRIQANKRMKTAANNGSPTRDQDDNEAIAMRQIFPHSASPRASVYLRTKAKSTNSKGNAFITREDVCKPVIHRQNT